jgi:hypothetical protein
MADKRGDPLSMKSFVTFVSFVVRNPDWRPGIFVACLEITRKSTHILPN